MKLKYTLLIVWGLITLGGMTLYPAGATANSQGLVDSMGTRLVLDAPPRRIVSLSPAATEVLDALGVGERLVGVTYHDARLNAAASALVVGGISNPSQRRIAALDPDLLIATGFHTQIIEDYRRLGVPVFVYETRSLDQGFDNIMALGRLVGRGDAAGKIVRKNREELAHIRAKLDRMRTTDKNFSLKRVIRLMGRNTIMTPGNDSFQNDLIRAAGGLPPDFGKSGPIVSVTAKEWRAFDPEFIYGCPPDKEAAAILSRPGWKEVSALKKGAVHYFPCDMTCRASLRTGAFVSWLASVIYPKAFARPENQVISPRVHGTQVLDLDVDFVASARILYSTIDDFENKTLVVNFKTPRSIVSTLDGFRHGITGVGNHYFPPPTWIPGHYAGMDHMKQGILKAMGRRARDTSFLITGADMDTVTTTRKRFKELSVTALITAGVSSNAMRMGKDTGAFYEPGTINIILLPNGKLSQRAMTRAIVSATEAKTAALQDLDIRSTYTPGVNQASGTGTDNVLVVAGDGPVLEKSGGHSKLGELIARAVYQGVTQAIENQNRILKGRDIFQRLEERGINVFMLASGADCGCRDRKSDFAAMTEYLLLQPKYAGFMEGALALEDARERGLLTDTTAFEAWCRNIVASISGIKVEKIDSFITDPGVPPLVARALDAVMAGARLRLGGGIWKN